MDFDWKGVLKTVAPGLATAFGGPLAGMAVAAIGNALGVSEPTQEKIQAALAGATPEDMLKVKLAEQQFVKDMRTLDVDLDRIAAGDRDSARKMQVETKSRIPAMLAALVTTGFFGILIGMMTGQFVTKDSPELLLLVGSLATAWGMVISFYFGSSAGSQAKDSTIRAMQK
jgi:hypothetical protein